MKREILNASKSIKPEFLNEAKSIKYYDERQYTIIKGVLENFGMSDEDITATIMAGEENNTPYFNLIKEVSEAKDAKYPSDAEDVWDKMTDAITEWNNEAGNSDYQFRMDDPDQLPNSSTPQYEIGITDSTTQSAITGISSLSSTAPIETPTPTQIKDVIFNDGTFRLDATATDKILKSDTDDMESLLDQIKKLISQANSIKSTATNLISAYSDLNEDTRNKLGGVIDSSTLSGVLDKTIDPWRYNLGYLSMKITKSIEDMYEADGTPPGGTRYVYDGGSYSGSSDSSTTEEPVVTPLNIAAIGSLTFTSIAPLYDTLGGTSTIQASLTGKYDVVGIYLYGDKYFYKIYDSSLNKYYFAEINGNCTFSTDYAQFLKMNEEAMMLTSTNIGENDNLSKMSDPESVYAVKGITENQNIQFASIYDPTDGNDYYVPLSSSVEMVDTSAFITGCSGVLSPSTNVGTSTTVPTDTVIPNTESVG